MVLYVQCTYNTDTYSQFTNGNIIIKPGKKTAAGCCRARAYAWLYMENALTEMLMTANLMGKLQMVQHLLSAHIQLLQPLSIGFVYFNGSLPFSSPLPCDLRTS